MRPSPEVGRSRVARNRIVVLLPAPLGPMKPKISPLPMEKLRSSTATKSPYRLVKLVTSIMNSRLSVWSSGPMGGHHRLFPDPQVATTRDDASSPTSRLREDGHPAPPRRGDNPLTHPGVKDAMKRLFWRWTGPLGLGDREEI